VTNKAFFPYNPVQPLVSEKAINSNKTKSAGKSDFGKILNKEITAELKFSKHAQQRMKTRNIELNEEDLSKLNTAVGKAREKGAKDSLILIDKLALLVSIKNNTVITAVDEENIQDNVFTNIDSAVIV